MYKIVIIVCFFMLYLPGLSQEVRKIKNQVSLNLFEHFYVLKKDKNVKHGEYYLMIGKDTIQKGTYNSGIKSGDWTFLKKGKTEFIYNCDSGIMVTDTIGKARGVLYSEGSALFDLMVALYVVYPFEAMQKRMAGTVLISFTINTDGTASDFAMEKSCNYPILDKEALWVIIKVATQYPWHPAINPEGEKFKTSIVRPIHFKLKPAINPEFRFKPTPEGF